jgi:hypothetical protein
MKENIEKLESIYKEIISEKTSGKVYFFGLLSRIDIEEKWDILISADWLKENNSQEDLVYIIKKLKDRFFDKLEFLSEIVLLVSKEPFIQDLARSLGKTEIKNKEIEGLKILDDFIIKKLYIINADFSALKLDPSLTIGLEGKGKKNDLAEF